MWIEPTVRALRRRTAALTLLAGGVLAAAPVAALELLLRNDTDEVLSCAVLARYRTPAGVEFPVRLIDDWWPMFPGQHMHGLPWLLWRSGVPGVSTAGASFHDLALQCRGGGTTQPYTLRAQLDGDDVFWDAWNGHVHHCVPEPGNRLTLHIMRFAPDGDADGFALRGSCWLAEGRGALRFIEPIPVAPNP